MKKTTSGGTRNAILQAALKTIAKLGYADASIGDIAKEARVNTVTVYRLFGSKESLFREVIARYSAIDLDEKEIAARLRPGDALEANLAALASAYFAAVFRNIDILRVFIIEAPHFDFVKQAAWYIPHALVDHCKDWLAARGHPTGTGRGWTERYAEMFVAMVTRRALEYNHHDRIQDFSQDLAADFLLVMRPQIRFMADLLTHV